MNHGLRRELVTLTGLASLGLFLAGRKSASLAAGLGCAALSLLQTPSFSFSNRSAIITGGSRGLGLALAEALIRQGAWVTILARDKQELERAQLKLKSLSNGYQALTICCDVTQEKALKEAIEKAEHHFGRIDLLINNAGSIAVGPFETLENADFTAQMDLQVQAVVNAIRFTLPAFRRAGGGRIANISSIGGMLPVPHMSSYCMAKFALAGLSESLAAELAPDNIRITTVYPGLMRTGSPIQAVFKGNHEKEYAWFAAGDVTPGLSVSAEEAAGRILEGIQNGDAKVAYPLVTQIGMFGHAVFPETFALCMRTVARFMPRGTSRMRQTGAASQGWLERQLWYKPLRGIQERAEKQLNQQEKMDANYNLGVLPPALQVRYENAT